MKPSIRSAVAILIAVGAVSACGGDDGGGGSSTGGSGGATGGSGGATGGSGGTTGGTGGATGGTGGATGGTGGATGGTGGATGGTGGTGASQAWLDNIANSALSDFEVDDTSIFLSSNSGIIKVAKANATPTTLGSGICSSLVLTSTLVVASCSAAIVTVPKSGGNATTLTAANGSKVLGADATHAYYVIQGSLLKVPLAGGSTVTLATDAKLTAAVSGVVSATTVFVNASGGVYGVPIAGGTLALLVSDSNPSWGDIEIDASTVFFSRASTTTAQLSSAPAAGGTATPIVTLGGVWFRVDGASLIHTGSSNYEIAKTPKAGGSKAILGTLPVSYRGVRVDATNTWVLATGSSTSSSSLFKLPK